MKKKLVSLLMCAAMISSMGLGVFAAEETEAAADNSDITIGSVIMNNSGEWFAEVIKGQEDAAADLGINFSMVSSDNEISKESDNVATFMAQGVDALVISPLAVDASVAAIETATKDAGIPVVTWNTTVNTDVTSHVGVVPAELGGNTGKYAAEYIKENFPDGCKIALIENSNYEIGIQRCEGFKAELQELIDDGTVEIVNEQDAELQEEGPGYHRADPDRKSGCTDDLVLESDFSSGMCRSSSECRQKRYRTDGNRYVCWNWQKICRARISPFRQLPLRCLMIWDIRQWKMQ